MGENATMKAKTRPHVVTTDAQIEAAIASARTYDEIRPNVIAASFRKRDDALVLVLKNGVEITIPRTLIQGLREADPTDVAKVEIEDFGSALHWEKLDLDHYVPGLIDGIFGTRKWMSELGSVGGRSRSEAKRIAAQENGRKGSRPKRYA